MQEIFLISIYSSVGTQPAEADCLQLLPLTTFTELRLLLCCSFFELITYLNGSTFISLKY